MYNLSLHMLPISLWQLAHISIAPHSTTRQVFPLPRIVVKFLHTFFSFSIDIYSALCYNLIIERRETDGEKEKAQEYQVRFSWIHCNDLLRTRKHRIHHLFDTQGLEIPGRETAPPLNLLYPICIIMRKKKFFQNSAIYLLFFTNTIYAAKHGTSWIYWLSAILTSVMLLLDIMELIQHVRKR